MFLALTLLIPAQAFLYDMITKSVSPQKITGINWEQIDYEGKFKRGIAVLKFKITVQLTQRVISGILKIIFRC